MSGGIRVWCGLRFFHHICPVTFFGCKRIHTPTFLSRPMGTHPLFGGPPLGCGEFAANRTFFVIAYRAPAHPSSHMTSSLNDLGDWVAWPRPCTGQLRLPVRCAALRGGRRPHEDYENRSTATIQNKLRRARILYILHALYVRTFAFQILGVLELRFSDFYFKLVSRLLRYW